MGPTTINQIQIDGDASIIQSSAGGTAHTATITITGTNDTPVITGDVEASVVEDQTENVSGSLSITDGIPVRRNSTQRRLLGFMEL